MNKLKQAARLALEALELARRSHGVMLMSNPPHDAWQYRGCDSKLAEAITTLREALDPELQFVRDWNEGKVRRVSDGKVMGFAEQAEQEPVAWMNTNGAVNKLREAGWAMNAAPVRTKDLTDDEIRAVWLKVIDPDGGDEVMALARAVIAADREKNK